MCAVTLLSGSLLQVPDVNASPRHVEVLGDEPAVTVVWFVFATEQAAAIELAGIEFVLDPAFRHQATEGDLVVLPRTLALPVGVKNGLRRRQDGDMDVVDPDDLLKEIRKILLASFANAESCDLLFSRASTSLRTPASLSFVKNSRALFFVNPIVKIVMPGKRLLLAV